MKREYDVCEGYSIGELREHVELALEDGWECLGGIAVTPYHKDNSGLAFEGLIFHQAITRTEVKFESGDEELASILNIAPEQLPEANN